MGVPGVVGGVGAVGDVGVGRRGGFRRRRRSRRGGVPTGSGLRDVGSTLLEDSALVRIHLLGHKFKYVF